MILTLPGGIVKSCVFRQVDRGKARSAPVNRPAARQFFAYRTLFPLASPGPTAMIPAPSSRPPGPSPPAPCRQRGQLELGMGLLSMDPVVVGSGHALEVLQAII